MLHNIKSKIFIFGFTLFLFSLSSLSVNASLSDDLRFYYALDETYNKAADGGTGSTTLSDSTGLNNVLLYSFGGVSGQFINSSSSCKIGNCTYINNPSSSSKLTLHFDNDQLSAEPLTNYPTASILSGESFSINSWIKIDDWRAGSGTGDNESFVIYGLKNGVSNSLMFGVYPNSSTFGYPVTYNIIEGANIAYNRPVSLDTWTMLTYVWNNITNTTYVYVNGQIAATNNFGVSFSPPASGPTGSNIGYFERTGTERQLTHGYFDEYAGWRRALTSDEVQDLYNGGNGLSYEELSTETPTQDFDLIPINLDFESTFDVYVNDFFSGYTDFILSFNDPITGTNELLETSKGGDIVSYITYYIYILITPIGDDLRVTFQSANTNLETTLSFIVLNSVLEHAFDSTTLKIIEGSGNAPLQFNEFPSLIELEYEDLVFLSMNDYFTNYDRLVIQFNDTVDNQTLNVSLFSDQVTYLGDKINITLTGNDDDIRMFITAGLEDYETPLSVFPYNGDSNLTVNSEITISEPLIEGPPVNINKIDNIELAFNENEMLNIGAYFTGYNQIQMSFVDDVTNETVLLNHIVNGSQVLYNEDHVKIQIYTSGLNSIINITSKETEFNDVYTIIAYNSFGSDSDSFSLNVSDTLTGVPEDTDSFAGFLGTMVNIFKGLFPDSESLTLAERLIYVLIVIAVVTASLIIATYDKSPRAGMFLAGLLDFLLIIFFIAIGYIPIFLFIVFALIAVFIAYFTLNKGGVSG